MPPRLAAALTLGALAALASLGLTAGGCASPDNIKEPPALAIASPARSLRQAGGGAIRVTGTALPNAAGTPVAEVLVNGARARLAADGSFEATIHVPAGATLIHTVARDADGTAATDTRAVHAGELRAGGAPVERAVTAAISKEALAALAAAAGPLIEGMDLRARLRPLQPMIRAGDPPDLGVEDCLFARVSIDDVRFANVEVSLVPQQGGLAFRAQLDGLDVPARARYAVACLAETSALRVRASRVVVAGTLRVTPAGAAGFAVDLLAPDVSLTGLAIEATGLPGTILDMIDLDSRIQGVIAVGAELAMEPLLVRALGALGGPQQLEVLGRPLTLELAPAHVAFTPAGATVALDVGALLGGAAGARFVATPNGTPALDARGGLQIGLADDLANALLAEAAALKLLDLKVAKPAGAFDAVAIATTLPPMISADPVDGAMTVVLGDVTATLLRGGAPVARAAINARAALAITESRDGYGVALEHGAPVIEVDVLDNIPNETRFLDEDLEATVEASLHGQLASISELLAALPLPAVAGLMPRHFSIGADAGYVMIRGRLE